jgi:hypothetical protein
MRHPPIRIIYQQQTYILREAQSSEPVQRAHDRIQSLIDRGVDPHAGTLRRLQSTSKPAKVHGIIQAAQHYADKATGPERAKWEAVVKAGKAHHQTLTGSKYQDERYDTPEKIKPAKLPKTKQPPVSRVVEDEPEAKPRKKKSKLPTSVSKPGKKGPSTTVQTPGQSKWVRVIRKRDGKVIQVRRGKHLNKKKYKSITKAAELLAVASV